MTMPSIRSQAGDHRHGGRFADVPASSGAVTDLRSARQAALPELARLAFLDRDVDRVMDRAAEVVHALFGASSTAILQLQADVRQVLVLAPHNWPATDVPGGEPVELAALAGAPAASASQRSTIVLGEPELPPHWLEHGARCGTLSVLHDPSGLPAALVTLHGARRMFSADELGFVDEVARIVSGSLARRWWDEETRRQPLNDPITGIANRACLLDRLRHALHRRARDDAFVAVYSVDLDRFRVINDTFGRQAGDEVLKTVAHRLRGALRREDTVARIGSDEFAVLSEHTDGERGALVEADRIIGAIAPPVFVEGTAVTLSVSIGIALSEEPDRTAEGLVRDADLAMDRAKRRAGSSVELFDKAMRRRATRRLSMEQGLRSALETDALELHYQPIVSLSERRIEGVEALLRWMHPVEGAVPPSTFIPVAEESGLIAPIGEWVMHQACRQAARWAADPAIGDVYVSINVSGVQLTDSGLAGAFAGILRQTGIDPSRIALEVTESVLMRDGASPAGVLARLKDLGVRLFLDDFGTGYSSLGQVKRLPLDVIKIDRSLVSGVVEADIDRRILAAIVSMGAALGVGVIAEGVEDLSQAQWLRRLGVRSAQGYGFARPKAPGAVELLLRDGLPPDRLPALTTQADAADDPPGLDARGDGSRRAEDGETITLSEAADALGVSHSTVRRWANSGRVPSVRTPGGHRRFGVSDVRRLSVAVTGRARPVLRQVPAPERDLRELADLLETHGDRLLAMTKRALYDEGHSGWFAGPPADPLLRDWLRSLSGAARAARWERALEATAQLMRHSNHAGSSFAERHGFLERFGEASSRELQRMGAERSVLANARRLFLNLLRVALTVGDRPA
jgi:diguanylate cyclase (GGDEF)-like protein/excisionase family DNA binding protein